MRYGENAVTADCRAAADDAEVLVEESRMKMFVICKSVDQFGWRME